MDLVLLIHGDVMVCNYCELSPLFAFNNLTGVSTEIGVRIMLRYCPG